jgi:hypothetical protein
MLVDDGSMLWTGVAGLVPSFSVDPVPNSGRLDGPGGVYASGRQTVTWLPIDYQPLSPSCSCGNGWRGLPRPPRTQTWPAKVNGPKPATTTRAAWREYRE